MRYAQITKHLDDGSIEEYIINLDTKELSPKDFSSNITSTSTEPVKELSDDKVSKKKKQKSSTRNNKATISIK